MEILKIRRTKQRTSSLKVYADVLGDSGQIYKVAYFRRPTYRGWNCTCDNFILGQQAKNRNCKHIKLVRSTYGRFAAQVPRTTATA
jgi:hypothetical protein